MKPNSHTVTDVRFAAALKVTHPVRAEDWNHLFHK